MRKNMRWWLTCALMAGVTGCLRSDEPGMGPRKSDAGCVWVVESDTTKLYLCGTIHLLRKQDFPLPITYDQAFADSSKLVFELPPGSGKGGQLGNLMAEAGKLDDGRSLYDLISPKTAEQFKAWAKRRKMNADTLSSFRPWLVAVMITATEYQLLGAEPDKGVDVIYEEKMATQGKTGEGLETVAQQIGLFSHLSEAQQAELLDQTLAEVEKLQGQFSEMVLKWRTGDINGLHNLLFEEAEKYPKLLDLFLNDRNAAWVPKLESYLKGNEKVMVLVGSGHLGGEKGVLALLGRKGYKIHQMSPVLQK